MAYGPPASQGITLNQISNIYPYITCNHRILGSLRISALHSGLKSLGLSLTLGVFLLPRGQFFLPDQEYNWVLINCQGTSENIGGLGTRANTSIPSHEHFN